MSLKRKKRVLAIDDEPAMTEWLKILLEHAGYEVKTVLIGTRGEEIFRTWRPDAVVTDMMLPDVDGIELVRKFKQLDPEAEVIVITGQGNIPRSVEAVKAGAFDFLEKPIDAERLLDKLEKAIKQKSLMDENVQLKQKLQDRYKFQNVIGKSKKMQELFELVESVAASEANILIQGENGTGKELIANAIHYNSKRSKGPFIKINCAAIPKDLIESELFGYKKGAFTGAAMDKEGLFEMAEGGSLLLDEIGEMPPYLQTKLLRVLQEREYRPIGSDRIVHVDFRLICATNADLDTALREGRLREDLYFRINTITLRVPPLRERTEDIPLLCDHFLDKFRQRYQQNVKTLAPSVYHLLIRNRWPGTFASSRTRSSARCWWRRAQRSRWSICPNRFARKRRTRPTSSSRPTAPSPKSRGWRSCRRFSGPTGTSRKRRRFSGLYRPTLYSKMKKHEIRDGGKVGAPCAFCPVRPLRPRADPQSLAQHLRTAQPSCFPTRSQRHAAGMTPLARAASAFSCMAHNL